MSSGFRTSTEAVSPVVAVVMLVAITLVLTVAVFAITSGIASNKQEPAPVVMSSKDDAQDRLVVVQADPGLPLSRLRLETSVPAHFAYNALASSASTALPANTLTPLGATGTVGAGDAIYFCANSPANNVQVVLQDPISNKIVATDTFINLAACT